MRAGVLFRNGRVASEPYVRHQDLTRSERADARRRMREWQEPHLVGGDTTRYTPDLQDWGPIVVPPDSLFMLGDNRDVSYDGRFWGFVPRANVRGTPLWIYFSYDPDAAAHPPQLFAIRWGRLGTRPH
jgi:signal peptidase I